MSSNPIATALATVASATPRLHSHRRGLPLTTSTAASGSTDSNASAVPIGAIGNVGHVGGTSSLFSNLLQSLQQGAPAGGLQSIATAAPGGAATTAGATSNLSQNVQAFTHSLFQALKQEQSSTSPAVGAATAGASASTASTAAPAGAGYRSNLVASLQDLIQQLAPGGRPTSATSTLAASYQQLANAVSSSGAAGTSAAAAPSSDSSKASLQNFLGGLVQSLQNTGVHSLNGLGANVNASV